MVEIMISNTKQRSLYLDIVKGVAITLVVFGHCLQYGTSLNVDDTYFGNSIFITIYSFHMPLFMLVSGYLFWGSANRHSAKKNVRSRISGLLVPIFSWNTLNLLLLDVTKLIKGDTISIGGNIQSYLSATWFLWSIFWCSLIVLIVRRFLHDTPIVYILLSFMLLFLPNTHGIPYHVYMYPYFVIGYFWNKINGSNAFEVMSFKRKLCVCLISIILFLILLFMYTKDDYIYTSGTCIFQHPTFMYSLLLTDLYRYIIGLVGSVSVLIIVRLSYKKFVVK